MGLTETSIHNKLSERLKPIHLDVINESNMHNVPKGSETHFKVIIVSDLFNGKSLLQRHRMVNELLAEELSGSVHALSIQAKTSQQWEDSNHHITKSPPCLGGSGK
ncbi:expressed hypothetical protein [Trichoplax adhaerens]|uniref:BolA-like protein n=1 Tax=Trichoplax adhaerens TaxID=10228 RepID=B3RW48_TRIAD|nr:expressed hypothetical protein [Trichoplax adhaerens]EDV26115.1 expressed hypothetical protein [Trichoplax adhaerens]|eukprot:XP_002112148.1 expressed hypothetical protein [Trichoplax adhaerens]